MNHYPYKIDGSFQRASVLRVIRTSRILRT